MSIDILDLARHYACAGTPRPEAISQRISNLLTGGLVRELVPRLPAEGAGGLRTALNELLERGSIGWQPELGIARSLSKTNPLASALQLAVAAKSRAEFSLQIAQDFRLYLDGWLPIVPAGAQVRLADDHIDLISGNAAVSFELESGRWTPMSSETCHDQRVLRSDNDLLRDILVCRRAGATGIFPPLTSLLAAATPVEKLEFSESLSNSVEQLSRAVSALAAVPREQANWIRTLAHTAVLLPSTGPTAATSSMFPGMVAMRSGCKWYSYMEALAAAVSHQKLHQVLLIERLTLSTEEELHYVASCREYTTTRRVLAAAYEHAHVILLLGSLEETCPPTDLDALQIRVLNRLTQLERECALQLDGASSLAPLGRLLWDDISQTCLEPAYLNDHARLPKESERKDSASRMLVAGKATK